MATRGRARAHMNTDANCLTSLALTEHVPHDCCIWDRAWVMEFGQYLGVILSVDAILINSTVCEVTT